MDFSRSRYFCYIVLNIFYVGVSLDRAIKKKGISKPRTYLVCLVWVKDERVDVRELVAFARNVLVDQVVLAVVVDNDVHLLGGRAANIRAKHDGVVGVTVELLGVVARREKLRGDETPEKKTCLLRHF